MVILIYLYTITISFHESCLVCPFVPVETKKFKVANVLVSAASVIRQPDKFSLQAISELSWEKKKRAPQDTAQKCATFSDSAYRHNKNEVERVQTPAGGWGQVSTVIKLNYPKSRRPSSTGLFGSARTTCSLGNKTVQCEKPKPRIC